MPNPSPSPAERFAAILWCLSHAVAAMTGGDRLPMRLISPIIDRLRGIKQRIARLSACIAAGSYVPPRRTARPRPRPGPRPRSPDPLPRQFGWLLPLIPDANSFRSQLEYLLRDEETVALLAAAPVALGRPIRSLCWALRLQPPPVIAPPAKPRPTQATPRRPDPPPPSPTPPSPAPPPAPWWSHQPPRPPRRPPPRIRGAPRPA